MRHILRHFCIVHAFFCFLCTGRAEISIPTKDTVGKPPPQAVPASVRVRVGRAVEIPLRVYGNETQVVKFRLRTQPKFGKISSPRMVSRDTAVVTYQNAGDDQQLLDKFFYTVQAANGVSVPAEVTITIYDDPPILAVPDEIHFGNVLVGRPSVREARIENQGGGVVEGRIKAPKNWKIEGNPDYRLRAGEGATFRIVCLAEGEMPLRGDLQYSSHPDRVTTLRGNGQMPLAISPQTVELRTARGDSHRRGVLQISNRTESPIPVRMTATRRLQIAEQINVPANGDISVPISTSGDDLDPIDEKLRLESSSLTMEVAVHAPAVGPIPHPNPGQLSLGSVDFEKPGSATLTVENIGGSSGFFRVEVPPPFKLSREDAAFPLDARAKRDVRVTIQPAAAGKFCAMLSIKAQDEIVELPVEAEVRSRGAAGAMVTAGPATAVEPPGEPTPQPATILVQAGGVQPVRRLSLKSVTRTGAVMEWEAPAGDKLQYKIESGQVSLDAERKLNIRWIPLTNIKLNESGKTIYATLGNLAAGTTYLIRVITMNAQGETSRFASELHFQTRPALEFFKVTPLRILLVTLVVLVAFIVRQRFAPTKSARRNSKSTQGKR